MCSNIIVVRERNNKPYKNYIKKLLIRGCYK
ncbi:hypothetical protein BE25_0009 [Staphylococcus phage vB_SepM_BE25]|nr:hypothetical protein BE24_0215 [Staphylococcus phage vB_SepM_BE24]WEU70495.1 hypothetical protein BE25_0009 [Staphylococcus phage vB_SepM_BE25]